MDTTTILIVMSERKSEGATKVFVETEDEDGRGVGIGEWVPYPTPEVLADQGEVWHALKIRVPTEDVRRS